MNKVLVPQIDSNSKDVVITSISVAVGEEVVVGQELAQIESLKTSDSILSPSNGFIREILYDEGDEIDVGELVIILTPTLNEKYSVNDLAVAEDIVLPSRPRLKEILDSKEQITSKKKSQFQKGVLSTLNLDLGVISYVEKQIDLSNLQNKLKEKNSIFNIEFLAIAWAFSLCASEKELYYSYFEENCIKTTSKVNLGITTEFKKKLFFINIENADSLSFKSFFERFIELQKKLTKNKLEAENSFGYSVAISSLANLDIIRHRAILPKGVSIIISHAKSENGKTNLGLSFDHRIHSGGDMSRFLSSIEEKINDVEFLENINE